MSRTVTLRLDEASYAVIKKMAELENRPLSNFIETATLRYISEIELADDYEMDETNKDRELLQSHRRGVREAKKGMGRFI
jgi:uncharacterized protein (DUF1778 family)